ncbi:unnamed protein product [Miscanthus lutarioriparius]|uniref:Uncharacterized protein n=1 Tax=Miscanthus lutarioriparius TaxID=422564 RepID=A0A811P4N6_9POAL|nr:unnamed protein product [Miscanthus lutarioriparius]
MDRGGAGSATLLRKRSLSVNTTIASAAAAAIDQFGSMQAGDVAAAVEEEPVSPTGRLFREPHFRCHIVSVFGLGAPVDLPALRAGVAATLARHPRFCSVQPRRGADTRDSDLVGARTSKTMTSLAYRRLGRSCWAPPPTAGVDGAVGHNRERTGTTENDFVFFMGSPYDYK